MTKKWKKPVNSIDTRIEKLWQNGRRYNFYSINYLIPLSTVIRAKGAFSFSSFLFSFHGLYVRSWENWIFKVKRCVQCSVHLIIIYHINLWKCIYGSFSVFKIFLLALIKSVIFLTVYRMHFHLSTENRLDINFCGSL